jgi:glycosyltransferase involved in cell wall biosynthesis
MRVAIVHDYLNQAGGAERVVAELHKMFPQAPIYTTIVDRRTLWPELRDADIRTSWMQWLPGVPRYFKVYLPFYARAIEAFDLRSYDIVISSSSAFAKAAITHAGATHVCYCHTPMRFGWDYDRYMERAGHAYVTRALLPPLIRRLREWDIRTADRPDAYVANSSNTADRIRRIYGRPSTIIPPPVDVTRYVPDTMDQDYFLVVSRLNGYKRVDLAVQAFNGFGRPLLVIGEGPVRGALERMADRNIRFVGRLPDDDVAKAYARCRALILPGEEDFGITPLEANAAGRPVVAFKGGGALDTVVDGETGVFFTARTIDGLRSAVLRCDRMGWRKEALRAHAERFGPDVFTRRFLEVIDRTVAERSSGRSEHPGAEGGRHGCGSLGN